MVKNLLMQKECHIEIDSMDKRGTFFGTLLYSNNKDLSEALVADGLAEINIIGNKYPTNYDLLEELEEDAKYEKKGVWNLEGSQGQGD